MTRRLPTVASIVAASWIDHVAIAHAAEGPTRPEYVAQVEPICQTNTLDSQRILAGADDKSEEKAGRRGRQFIRAAAAFGKATGEIAAVPPPPADQPKLTQWIEHLRLVQTYLRKAGKALQAGDRRHATIDVDQAAQRRQRRQQRHLRLRIPLLPDHGLPLYLSGLSRPAAGRRGVLLRCWW